MSNEGKTELAKKLFKFGLVGCSGMLLDFGVTYLAKESFGFNSYLANAMGFSIAVTSNYFINRFWTFEERKGKVTQQLISFVAIAFLGLLINSTCIYVGVQVFRLNFYLAKIVAIGIVFFWNFFANYFITFKKRGVK